MTPDQSIALSGLVNATVKLLGNAKLAYANPGEPVLTSDLGHLLKTEFPQWDVNNEYDRREQDLKRLPRLDKKGNKQERKILPDIIVHQIGQKNNLLAIEAKRIENKDFDKDIWKLRGMTDQSGAYAYKVGVHLVLDLRGKSVPICGVYTDGELNEALTQWLRDRMPVK